MKKLALLLIIPFTLLLGIQTASAKQKTTAPASMQRAASTAKANWNSFKPETLSGTITVIQPGKKSVYVTASDGVSFHFRVTPKTKIRINGTRSSMADLAEQAHNQATVTFVAWPKGDVAKSITVSS